MKSVSRKAGLAGLIFSLSFAAEASTYAVSVTSIDNFLLTGATVSGWTFSQNMATSGGTTEAYADVMDPAAACVGCSYDNAFSLPHASTPTGPYAYSDARISSTAVTTTGGAAAAIAEVYADDGVNGSGMASNSMTAFVTITNPTVSVSFDVSSYLEVAVTPGDIGFASMSLDMSIFDMSNNLVSNVAPFDLAIGPTDDSYSVNLTNQGFSLSGFTVDDQYKLNISMTQQVFTNVQPVPVPAAAWLFGSGLLGLVGVARRRKAA